MTRQCQRQSQLTTTKEETRSHLQELFYEIHNYPFVNGVLMNKLI